MNREQIAWWLGFLLASWLWTSVIASYFIFCPHAKDKDIHIWIRPNQSIKLPDSTPNNPAPNFRGNNEETSPRESGPSGSLFH